MLKEKIKSSAILILIANLLFLTVQLWFLNSNMALRQRFIEYVRQFPIVETFFPIEPEYSISKENLAKPRKFLINDGSLWMAYYNTDMGFSPINERTKEILSGFINGEITATKKIDRTTWEAGLESLSIYVEYPVSFSPEMFCRIMGTSSKNIPKEVGGFREFIIIPTTKDSDICILVYDNTTEDQYYAYILNEKYSLPAEDLSVYTSNDDGYYEPAFSTGLSLNDNSNVKLAPLVLFSDSQPLTKTLQPNELINKNSLDKLLENFSFNAKMNPYEDSYGAIKYIANYANATLYPDGVFEYDAVSDERGILLDESGNSYNVLNSSIDFAEQIWSSLSDEPLSILVTSDLSGYDSSKPYTFKFDYYCNGRPVKVNLSSNFGHEPMNSAIEITVKDGLLISYRQYMRSYQSVYDYILADNFVTALDYFVQTLEKEPETEVTIEDIYIGYTDNGSSDSLYASWIAKTSNNNLYRYQGESAT